MLVSCGIARAVDELAIRYVGCEGMAKRNNMGHKRAEALVSIRAMLVMSRYQKFKFKLIGRRSM